MRFSVWIPESEAVSFAAALNLARRAPTFQQVAGNGRRLR